ncbi:hypothetical protein Pla123a_05230 [Posidoniimonas polymericola]|uniref:Uncharacterized protein n=1 Tax=Posidoniimonas polymericola TaxID=2528002 RepID=A0A5C5ZEX5_9BACT|nr:hypothetical protein Pla123a_05230 [Posidoniimonas polymericola]
MSNTSLAARVIGLCVLLCSTGLARPITEPHAIEINPTEFRSAVFGPTVWDEGLDREEIDSQLTHHFAAVVETLERNRNYSLLVALWRAEAVSRTEWTYSQRRQALRELASRRELQMHRLRYYAERGLFPQNQGESASAAPIFVDQHGTHCAVGFLIHCDGLDGVVAQIVARDNLVRVMDVRGGPLATWLLTSGLTQEEAGIIQPGYPLALDATLQDFATPGTVVVSNGMTLTELSWKRVEVAIDSSVYPTLPAAVDYAWASGLSRLASVSPISTSAAGALLVAGDFTTPFSEIHYVNRLDSLLYVGPRDSIFGTLLGGRIGNFPDGYAQLIQTEFVLQAGEGRIESFGVAHHPSYENGRRDGIGLLRTVSEIYDADSNELIALNQFERSDTDFDLGNLAGYNLLSSEVSTVGAKRVRVKSYSMSLAPNAAGNEPEVHSYFFEFGSHPVPEPHAVALTVLAVPAMGCRRRRKNLDNKISSVPQRSTPPRGAVWAAGQRSPRRPLPLLRGRASAPARSAALRRAGESLRCSRRLGRTAARQSSRGWC